MLRLFYTIFLCLLSFSTLAQKSQRLKVTGKITDESKKPLAGAVVLEMGTNNSTLTDAQGGYTLYVGYVRANLSVSLENYMTIEHDINGQLTQNFQLREVARLTSPPVVGSHTINRSLAGSPASVDVIDVKALTASQGQFDLNQLLSLASPSFSSNRQTGAAGSDQVDPVSLRGMGPDQMLVLVNGKRRHQSGLVNLSGSRGRGNSGTDLNTIPVAAIDRIEILREGAVAQYGSDAIAGVINIVLKETVGQLVANANAGINMAKYRFDNKAFDGLTYNGNVNYGMKVAQTGFVNVTLDYNFRDHTNRGNTVDSAGLLRRQYGDARLQNGSLYYNARIPVSRAVQVYSFGGANRRYADSYSWTRFRNDARNIVSVYPKGFDPIVGGQIDDIGLTAGARAVWRSWDIDLSQTYGVNKFDYSVNNSLNRSFGAKSLKSFDAGGFQLSQLVSNLNVTRMLKGILSGLNVAAGAEYRIETYKIFAGENMSWRNYDPALVGGAQGFSGFGIPDARSKSRSNIGAYLEGSLALTPRIFLDGAGRYENYSDFGNAISWKGGARFQIDDKFVVRASVSTGFRAPSMSQKYLSYTVHELVKGKAVEILLADNGSVIANALKVPSLKKETTEQANLGFTVKPFEGFSISVDGYYIKVKDRIILTGQFGSEDKNVGTVLKDLNVSEVRFFTNGLSQTTTMGVDVAVGYTKALGMGNLTVSARGNFNYMELGKPQTNTLFTGKDTTYLSRRERYFILASAPPSKVNLTLDYQIGKFGVMVRGIRFGEIKLLNSNVGLINPSTGRAYTASRYTDVYRANFQADVTLRYAFGKHITLAIGGSNILNTYPDLQTPALTESGGAWDPVQMGSNGAFFFTRLAFKF